MGELDNKGVEGGSELEQSEEQMQGLRDAPPMMFP